jgi:hypothetical protein
LIVLAASLVLVACGGSSSDSPVTPRDDRALCAELCDRIAACDPAEEFPGAAACTRTCVEDQRRASPACRAARVAYERCTLPLTCEVLQRIQADPGDPTSPCKAAFASLFGCDGSSLEPRLDFQF